MSIREELCEVAGIEQKKGENFQKFSDRLVKAVDTKLEADDTVWNTLSPEAQTWFNNAVDEASKKVDISPFPGEESEEAPAKGKKGKGKAASTDVKPDKPKREGKGRPRREVPFPMTSKIKRLSKENPKRVGTKGAEQFEKYKDGMTVEEALKSGFSGANLEWDVNHKFISIS